MEFKRVKSNTGRLSHLCLPNSEILVGVTFDEHPRFQAVLATPNSMIKLVYPSANALDVSNPDSSLQLSADYNLILVILDATWAVARSMYNRSPCLQSLSAIRFSPTQKSRYIIKKQPMDFCLSTIEVCYELIQSLQERGYEAPIDAGGLIDLFMRMQDYQIQCMQNPPGQSYRVPGT